uniref:Uncharacterized protein n=1 Tax=Rhizophora mucronata TaxID=61149 RepID=A0A2P2NC39_RHIMU
MSQLGNFLLQYQFLVLIRSLYDPGL